MENKESGGVKQKPYQREKDYSDTSATDQAEVILWQSVIIQALRDLQVGAWKDRSSRTVASSWVFSDSPDFYVACDLSGWTPDYIRRIARKIIDEKINLKYERINPQRKGKKGKGGTAKKI